MKAFVSSLITGMQPLREAARDAVETARMTPLMAEDFGARPATPQVTCLQGVREADVVVLILGDHYGAKQPSGVSATHEEWDAAKDLKPILVFVQEGVDREPLQTAFVEEVERWASGRFRAGFRDARELRIEVGRNLIDWQRSVATAPVDEADMLARAGALLPVSNRGFSMNGPVLTLVVASGPTQRIVRPVEMEGRALGDALRQAAMFGDTQLFDGTKGVTPSVTGSALTLTEERGGSVQLGEDGSLRVSAALGGAGQRRGISAVVEEEVRARLVSGLNYAAWVLEKIDPTQRLTHVAVAASLSGAEHTPWMTQAEVARSNGGYSMGMTTAPRSPVQAMMPRGGFRLDRTHLVDDLLVLLRRQSPRGSVTGF